MIVVSFCASLKPLAGGHPVSGKLRKVKVLSPSLCVTPMFAASPEHVISERVSDPPAPLSSVESDAAGRGCGAAGP